MIIKSHIRAGYRDAAAYLKAQGLNEKIRTVEISDIEASNLDEAFKNMWAVASYSHVKKPLHHISINPYKDERLTDEQVLRIVERCEKAYGYKSGEHQRVIVEHIRDGRQHFHVMWNRVSLETHKAIWPGLHWNKSKEVAREMEAELGLKRPKPKRTKSKQLTKKKAKSRSASRTAGGVKKDRSYQTLKNIGTLVRAIRVLGIPQQEAIPAPKPLRRKKRPPILNEFPKLPLNRDEVKRAEHIAWAWENGRYDILAIYGIYVSPDVFEP